MKVRLSGLNVRRSRGKWYVSLRANGKALVKGFEGTRAALDKHMRDPAILALYADLAAQEAPKKHSYPQGTVGHILDWYRDGKVHRWNKLADRTKADYDTAILKGLKSSDLVFTADQLSQADIYRLHNRVHGDHWARIADNLVSVMSAAFSEAVKVGMMTQNPAKGIERVSKADKNANREWKPEEFTAALEHCPAHLLPVYVIARYQGLRGQTIQPLLFQHITFDAEHQMEVFDYHAAKNNESIWQPVMPETKAMLTALGRDLGPICLDRHGNPWKTERALQADSSRFLTKLAKEGKVAGGLTLHGLRSTFAADLKRRNKATNREIADALADRSERMGAHYSRHVETKLRVLRAMGFKG